MILLGSTGSIGVNTLNIAREFGLEVETLVAGRNIALLQKQVEEFRPRIVVVADPADCAKIEAPIVLSGQEGILEAIERSQSALVVNALVGFLGLRPTLLSQKLGKRIALANKESLVVAGKFIDTSRITPIDSEHFALWYAMQGKPKPKKLIITASGGALRDWPIEQMAKATFAEALNHPNWSMGYKITIDSATMTNKLFELLEAYWLYGTKNLDAIIETKSIIHAIVEFVDGSSLLHASSADMRLPIAFALLGQVDRQIVEPVDFVALGALEFRSIDVRRYPLWQIKEELLQKPDLGVVINAANEVAIERFRARKIGFFDMAQLIMQALKRFGTIEVNDIEDVFKIDKEVRDYVAAL